ncbi:prolyl oligopeptidase family serine peptidase [Paenibacillus ginsengarvi]|uniref:S9 family peptidase n=1 Tax=Paenibacillus ginsengarvi TaxID=400777 RepID=A0A3B0AP30_9BACL|nr:prolyl oligopeptidase family serine peptidase [Paenibacillus ginsengarvi]RKN62790.1 S9 family peptidase [Paenibacillus ginsengarvi]
MPHEKYAFDEKNRSIWKVGLPDGEAVRLTSPQEDAHTPRWSPDGNRITYISRASGQKEIWLMDADGSNRKQLTRSSFKGHDPFHGSTISWSPDGRNIVYTTLPNGSKYGQQQLLKQQYRNNRDAITIVSEPLDEVKTMYAPLMEESELYVLNVATGENKLLLKRQHAVCSVLDWFNDSELLIKCGRDWLKVSLQDKPPVTVYSGKHAIARIVHSTELLLAQKSGTSRVDIFKTKHGANQQLCSAAAQGEVKIHCWSYDGTKVYVTCRQGVSNVLYRIDAADGSLEPVTEAGRIVRNYDHLAGPVCSRQSDLVIFPYGGPDAPAELWTVREDGSPQQLTRFHLRHFTFAFPQTKIVHYPSGDWEIESLLLLPPGYDPNCKYPSLIYLHGGPELAVEASFTELASASARSAAHYLAAHGYVVLLPNFRGSAGYGEAFKNELGDCRILSGPYQDIMAGTDYLIHENIADPDALGLYGSSYGATLAAWTITQTDRFKGAVGAVGFYDMLHLDRARGTAFHAMFKNRLGDGDPQAMWQTPEVYEQMSPIEQIALIKTPFLLIETGAERKDGGSSGTILLHGLRHFGVKSHLVWYPRAFHNGGWNEEYKKDYMLRLRVWFDHCLKDEPLPEWFASGQQQ